MGWCIKQIAYRVMALSCISHGGEAKECSVSDISIRRSEVIVESAVTYVTGVVANECPNVTGVKIHVTLRDDEGGLVLTGDFWPAGTRNIPSHSGYEFIYAISPGEPDPERRASSIQVDIVTLRQWRGVGGDLAN